MAAAPPERRTASSASASRSRWDLQPASRMKATSETSMKPMLPPANVCTPLPVLSRLPAPDRLPLKLAGACASPVRAVLRELPSAAP